MGGSFDPIHQGHLNTALAIKALLNTPTVYLMPAARSPLKQTTTSDGHRLAMLNLGISTLPGLHIDDRELKRPSPSYTIDSLRALREELGPDQSIVWVMGSDTLQQLDQWKDWQHLTDYAHLLVIQRPGFKPTPNQAITAWLDNRSAPDGLDRLNLSPCGHCVNLDLPPQPFSSTAIRLALRQGAPPEGLPESVWLYIQAHQLYR